MYQLILFTRFVNQFSNRFIHQKPSHIINKIFQNNLSLISTFLYRHKEIFIAKSDKGGATVIIKKDDFFSKRNLAFNNS